MKFLTTVTVIVASVVLACLPSTAAALKTQHEPSGSYCGSYMANMVIGKVTMNSNSNTFDLSVKAFGNNESTCRSIQYVWDRSSGQVSVPDAHNSKSCLGDLLASGGLSLDVSYDAAKDTVQLDLGIAKLTLRHC